MIPSTRNVTIFEGPDGGGKTTLATEYAKLTNARLVHCGPFTSVKKDLARFYVEAMLPALLGYQDVVLDRSWLSELPYGAAFRGGKDRIGPIKRRILERIAMRCGAVVVKCLPDVDVCVENYRKRRDLEMLTHEDQLRHVHACYEHLQTELDEVMYDYTTYDRGRDHAARVEYDVTELRKSVPCHVLDSSTVGNRAGGIAIVGDAASSHKSADSLIQFPFCSLSGGGCSSWLTRQLHQARIPEYNLLWANQENGKDLLVLPAVANTIIALGENARQALKARNIDHLHVPHPQAWKRFHHYDQYPLVDIIKEHRA